MEEVVLFYRFICPKYTQKKPDTPLRYRGEGVENDLEIGVDAHFQASEREHLITGPGGAGGSPSTFSGKEDGIVLGAKAGI